MSFPDFSKNTLHIKPGLERMKKAMRLLGLRPHDLIPSVLIAGTNGKGSSSGMLWHLLSCLKIPVGLFTSPHLVNFEERFQCSHTEVSIGLISSQLDQLKTCLGDFYEELSFFEVSTLLAFIVFKELNCRFMVLEVGLGGQWDATNCAEPLASAVISIDFDHREWLGDSLDKIAGEKLGVARRLKPLFWGESYEKSEVENCLQKARASKEFVLLRSLEHFSIEGEEVKVNIPGLVPLRAVLPDWVKRAVPYLQKNFALSFALFYWLLEYELKEEQKTSQERAKQALAHFANRDIPWPVSLWGRFQRLQVPLALDMDVTCILDGCHNLAAVREFVSALKSAKIVLPIPGFVSILADKDVNEMLDLLGEVLDPIYLFKVDTKRTLQAKDIATHHQQLKLYDDFDSLWFQYQNQRQSQSLPRDQQAQHFAVCGSFYAVGEVLEYFKVSPKPQGFFDKLSGQNPYSLFYAHSPYPQ